MKAFVTGSTGFLGRHLVPTLKNSGVEVIGVNSVSCNLLDKENLLQFKDQKFDFIYHLAAWTKAGDFCLYHKGEQWIVNQLINTNLLWFWQKYQPKARLVTMGSSCSYPPELDLAEPNYMVGEPDRDLYTYAMTKRMLYEGCRALQHQFGMQYNYLIPSTLYGPKFDEADTHFIFDLIKKIWSGKYNGTPVQLWGNGSQVRELIFIEDALRLIDLSVKRGPNDLLNLGSGIAYSIREYAEMICEIIGYDPGDIQYDTTKFSGVSKKVFNTAKIQSFYNFKFTDIREGLASTISYFDQLKKSN